MSGPATATQLPSPKPVDTRDEAERLIKHLIDVMDALLAMVEEETEWVRAGKLDQMAAYEQTKIDLSRLYLADTQRIKANQETIAKLTPARQRFHVRPFEARRREPMEIHNCGAGR